MLTCFTTLCVCSLTGSAWTQVIYMDTEGFEASGKSDAYDDRVFALSTFISALLIYNLPETVRESDIEKLSFAVELAQAFFADMKARNSALPSTFGIACARSVAGCCSTCEGTVYALAHSQGDGGSSVEPGNMLWLIQRDFLEGKSVEAMVKESLAPVANPHGDRDITQVLCSARMSALPVAASTRNVEHSLLMGAGEQDPGVAAFHRTQQQRIRLGAAASGTHTAVHVARFGAGSALPAAA